MTHATPTIHIVDDDAAFRTAVGRLLEAVGYQVAHYESGEQLLRDLPNGGTGCVLVDMRMPGLSGLELQGVLAERGHLLPIIFLTGYGDIPSSVRAIKAGAEDFLSKPVSKETLFEAIERALARFQEISESAAQLNSLEALVATLTAREREVFSLVVSGKLNKQIAYALDITERTVKAHRHAVMEKLQVRSVAALVSIAERLRMSTAPGPRPTK